MFIHTPRYSNYLSIYCFCDLTILSIYLSSFAYIIQEYAIKIFHIEIINESLYTVRGENGQASCLVSGLTQTGDFCKTYSETPKIYPTISVDVSDEEDSDLPLITDELNKMKFSTHIVPYSKDNILKTMKIIGTNINPNNEDLYENIFMTSDMQYALMSKFFTDLNRHCSVNQLQYWLGQSKIWGPLEKVQRHRKTIHGRNVWILKEEFWYDMVNFTDSLKTYWQHVSTTSSIINIGYARKSKTKESNVDRVRLLQLMINKLSYKLKCQDIFVSPLCGANEPILNRDSPKQQEILDSLTGCKVT